MNDAQLDDLEKKIAEGGFGNSGINPTESFNKNTLINRILELQTMQGYAKRAKETGNPAAGLRKDVVGLLFPGQNKSLGLRLDEVTFKELAKRGVETIEGNMAEHVYHHWDNYLDAIESAKTGAEIYADLILNKKVLFKIDGDDSHNRICDLVNAAREVDGAIKAASQGDSSKVEKIIQNEVKARKLSGWQARLTKEFLWDDAFRQLMLGYVVNARKTMAQATIMNSKGKVDIAKARSLIDKSKREAWRLYNDEPNEGTRGDIKGDDLTPYALNIANAAAAAVHPDYVKDVISRFPEAEDAAKRAQERKFAGLGTGINEFEDTQYALAE